MKYFVIFEHEGRAFANRLWNDMSIYAYGLHEGTRTINLTYFEHTRFGRPLHLLFARLLDRLTRRRCGLWAGGSPKNLPPSVPSGGERCSTLFFSGWLFRNPVGFTRYREALLAAFGPTKQVQKTIAQTLTPLAGKVLIGVYIRQTPYRGFTDGTFLISPARVRTMLEEYLREKNLRAHDVGLVVVSDRAVPPALTQGFDTVTSTEEKEGFFLLSKCSAIIGENSTFPNLAAWFADAPHIVTSEQPIVWAYYKDKTAYFDNQYATFTRG
ncbi:hypothetical protein EXS62_02910 [Candidatus Kaiserbacteria bacterium]|nr:hypothetical protein [Candidatus Kaiserbacteria bacterium]